MDTGRKKSTKSSGTRDLHRFTTLDICIHCSEFQKKKRIKYRARIWEIFASAYSRPMRGRGREFLLHFIHSVHSFKDKLCPTLACRKGERRIWNWRERERVVKSFYSLFSFTTDSFHLSSSSSWYLLIFHSRQKFFPFQFSVCASVSFLPLLPTEFMNLKHLL